MESELYVPPQSSETNDLTTRWELWLEGVNRQFSSSGPSSDFVDSFTTVEKFWSVFGSIPDLSQMPRGVDIYIMRENVVPTIRCPRVVLTVNPTNPRLPQGVWEELV